MNTASIIFAFILHVLIMLAVFVYAHQKQKADWVDVAWCFSIVIAAGVYGVWHIYQGLGGLLTSLVVCAISMLWYTRLGSHLFKRIKNDPHEDSRYQAMRQSLKNRKGKQRDRQRNKSGEKPASSAVFKGFLLFFLFQALLASLFALPVWVLTQVDNVNPGFLIVGVFIVIVAFIGESIADKQLYLFKQNPDNKGQTMKYGLWRYSRHPNYFFEWLYWFSYPIIGLGAGVYWLWVFPVLMYVFLIYITGIPFSEKQALAKRSDYRAYQQSTPMFFPRLF